MTSSGSVSNHLWCSRYKDCIHLLTALCSHCGTDNYLTVSGQQGLCRPFVALMQVVQVCISALSSSETLNAEGFMYIQEWANDKKSSGKLKLVQEKVDGFDSLMIF